MSTVTAFISQAFRKEGRRLVADPQQSHKTPEAAIDTARRLSDRKAGAVAFSVTGNPDVDNWEDPVILFKGGELPKELQGDDD
ncbi:hypothetical protein SAMN05216548_101358 [Faunimonas pinastri]|uniref:Uncharacterized protein n=1 Tax=Faunimonas pinastri TaxID=1855383 RepID=A0A1H9A8N9_9HYPH|nr:hypothetical protein [Faunimonas pinastri]SEP73029.1 hypothetical protein SAMN05216548_101358 [Faunimonas pinastri]